LGYDIFSNKYLYEPFRLRSIYFGVRHLTYGDAIGYICMSLSGSGSKRHGKLRLPAPFSLKGCNTFSPTTTPWVKGKFVPHHQPEGL